MFLQARNLFFGHRKGKRTTHALGGPLELDIREGEIICLLGPNGSGKSTLLRTLSGLLPPLDGSVSIRGTDLRKLPAKELARLRSIVLTHSQVPGLMRVETLVSLGRHPHLQWTGTLGPEDREEVLRALDSVQALGLKDRFLGELSDGERQRVSIAQALAQSPSLLFLDEPSSFLDLPGRIEIFRILRELAHNHGNAVLLSTHDLDLALHTADRLWVLGTDGHLHQGCPEDLVLRGDLQKAFASESIQFDSTDGRFRIRQPEPTGMHIHLEGTGPVREWTRRALERTGYTLDTDPQYTSAIIGCHSTDKSPRWHIRPADPSEPETSFSNLEELLRHLQNIAPKAPNQ